MFPRTSLIALASRARAGNHVRGRTEPACRSQVVRVGVTGGVLRAVGFRRQVQTFDVALRYRFAYSLEHYD